MGGGDSFPVSGQAAVVLAPYVTSITDTSLGGTKVIVGGSRNLAFFGGITKFSKSWANVARNYHIAIVNDCVPNIITLLTSYSYRKYCTIRLLAVGSLLVWEIDCSLLTSTGNVKLSDFRHLTVTGNLMKSDF